MHSSAVHRGAQHVRSQWNCLVATIERLELASPNMYSQHNPFGLTKVYNFRLVAENSADLNQNLVYRSANFTNATPGDVHILLNVLSMKTYIDLRTDTGNAFSDSFSGTMKRLHYSVADRLQPMSSSSIKEVREFYDRHFSDGDQLFEDPARHELFLRNYMIFCSKYNGPIIANVLRAFADQSNYPIVFGCHAGKDRTGLVALLLLKICGVDDQQIVLDYLMSNMGLGSKATGGVGGAVYLGALKGLLQWMVATHGSVLNYIRSTGLREHELRAIRNILCVDPTQNTLPAPDTQNTWAGPCKL